MLQRPPCITEKQLTAARYDFLQAYYAGRISTSILAECLATLDELEKEIHPSRVSKIALFIGLFLPLLFTRGVPRYRYCAHQD